MTGWVNDSGDIALQVLNVAAHGVIPLHESRLPTPRLSAFVGLSFSPLVSLNKWLERSSGTGNGHKRGAIQKEPHIAALGLSKKVLTSLADGEASSPAIAPSPVFAEILQISGRKNCKETIFALKNEVFRRKNRLAPTVHAAGHAWKFERASALSSVPVFSTG